MQDIFSSLPLETIAALAALAYLQLGLFLLAWRFGRKTAELRRRLALEQANRCSLLTRFEEAVSVLENRLNRLDGSGEKRNGRGQRRREAVRSIRAGADPAATAKRFRLPRPELRLLLELQSLQRASAPATG